MFADDFTFGFTPKPRHLDAHLALLGECAPATPWMVAGLGVDIRPLIDAAVARGGPYLRSVWKTCPGGRNVRTANLVEEAVKLVNKAGGEPASATDVRNACKTLDAKLNRGYYVNL